MPETTPTPVTVTLDTIIDQVAYTPRAGTRYEIADGITGTMKRPTIELQEQMKEVIDRQDEYANADATATLLITEHPEVDEKKLIGPVARQVVLDFFSLSRATIARS